MPSVKSVGLAIVCRIGLRDAKRLAVLVVVGRPPVRRHGVVQRLASVGVAAVEELVRRKRLQRIKESAGRVVRQVSPSLHRHALPITVGGVVARRLQSGSLAGSKDVGAVARAFDVDRSKNESVVLHRLLRRFVPGHAQRHPVLVVADGPSVRRASVVQGKTVVADSVEELVEEKRKFAVVVGMGQVSAREHSHAVAVVVVGMVARGLQLRCLAGSEDVVAVGFALDLHRGEEPAIASCLLQYTLSA